MVGEELSKSTGSHISQLSHKDIRIRRRALRALFEIDSPNNLEAFIPLLDDKDSWFRSKALEAHRMWAPRIGIESLETLASHKSIDARRCAANLLEKFDGDTSSIAKVLYHDDDNLCKIKASKALIKCDYKGEFTSELINSENDKVKIIALSSKHISKEQLLSTLEGSSLSVKEKALNQLSIMSQTISDEKLSELLLEGVNPIAIVPFSIDNGGKTMIELAENKDSKVRKSLVDKIKHDCESTDDDIIKLLIKNRCFAVIGRWLQGKKDQSSDELRWQIIENEELDEIERSRLLERLIGRCNEPEIVRKSEDLIQSTSSELLRITAQNLSTAGN